MDYNTFIQLVKQYERPPQLIAYPQPMRSALHRTPEAFANLLHSVMPVLQDQLSNLCLNASVYMGVFGFQPAAFSTPSRKDGKDDLWYTLDFDMFEQSVDANPKFIKSDAIFINMSTGFIVNGAYYKNLVDTSFNSKDAVCYSQIPLAQLQQAWAVISQNANAKTSDINCSNLCRAFYYPSIPAMPAPLQQQKTSPTPSFWRKGADSQLTDHIPSHLRYSKDTVTASCQADLSISMHNKHSI